MEKTFVLDTNVLLHNPHSLESFEDNRIVLPMAVIEELDTFKSRNDELGRSARHVIRTLDSLRIKGALGDGVDLENGGVLAITTEYELPRPLSENKDNQILGTAYKLRDRGKVIFVTKDINLRIKADSLGLETMDFESGKINIDELYSGVRELTVSKDFIDRFFGSSSLEAVLETPFYPNEFVHLRNELNPKHTALARAVDEKTLKHLSPQEKAWNIGPRSLEQRVALELLLDPSVQIVTLVGQAGTGKTLLAIAAALHCVLKTQQYEKILVSRPIMPFGRDLGYLPGDKDEKIHNWMQPIFDNLDYLLHNGPTRNWIERALDVEGALSKDLSHARGKTEFLLQQNILELEALTYIRGRSIPRQYMVVDESQNLTPHEIKTIISRAGEGTKVVLTGDPYQIDNPYLDSCSNGLTHCAERLKGESVQGHIMLSRSERSELAAIAANLL